SSDLRQPRPDGRARIDRRPLRHAVRPVPVPGAVRRRPPDQAGETQVNDRLRLRLVILRVLAASLLVTLGARLWVLQVLDGAHYRRVAEDNRVREVVTPAPR